VQDLKSKLKELYDDSSKHSRYQNVPEFVREALGYAEAINEEWRGDTARYRYLCEEMDFPPGSAVGDVGANTGFFTLSLAHRFRDSSFIAYEANPNHARFIRLIAEHFGLDNVSVRESMVDLRGVKALGEHRLLLFLNVLHHAGYDFDVSLERNPGSFRAYALQYLRRLSRKASRLFFQMGSNWGGDKKNPLVPREDDTGKILFAASLFAATGWEVRKIALARKHPDSGGIAYENIPEGLVEDVRRTKGELRMPALEDCVRGYELHRFPGEFYRRPLFVCDASCRP